MTGQPVFAIPVAGSVRRVEQRLSQAVDVAMLVGLGWDLDTQVFTPDPAHRLLGYRVCSVLGCGSEAWCRDGLCGGCSTRRSAAPGEPLAAFLAAGMGQRRRPGQRLCKVCRVPGAQRPAAANGLCRSCDHLRAVRGQGVAGFIGGDHRYGPAAPRPTIGTCAVVSCGRLVDCLTRGLCGAHDQAWRKAGGPELAAFCSTSSPRRGDRQGRVVLRGLPERVIAELLLGVQACLGEGRRLMPTDLRAVVDHLREHQAGAVADLDTAGYHKGYATSCTSPPTGPGSPARTWPANTAKTSGTCGCGAGRDECRLLAAAHCTATGASRPRESTSRGSKRPPSRGRATP